MDIEAVYSIITRKALIEMGFSPQVLSDAVRSGKFPAAWFVVIEELLKSKGYSCPKKLFRFRSAPGLESGDAK
jgi:hypothetical protein